MQNTHERLAALKEEKFAALCEDKEFVALAVAAVMEGKQLWRAKDGSVEMLYPAPPAFIIIEDAAGLRSRATITDSKSETPIYKMDTQKAPGFDGPESVGHSTSAAE